MGLGERGGESASARMHVRRASARKYDGASPKPVGDMSSEPGG